MVEVVTILAIATKEVKRGRLGESMICRFSILVLTDTCAERYFRKLVKNTDIEDSLQRLDRLTQEEGRARIASAELLKVTHNVDAKVMGVDDRVKDVEGRVEDVQDDIQDVGNKVQNVDGRVQDVQGDLHDVGNKVQYVDNRVQGIGSGVNDISCEVREVNRSLSP